MNKRERLNNLLDGVCSALGIEHTDEHKAILTRAAIGMETGLTDHFKDIAQLALSIREHEAEAETESDTWRCDWCHGKQAQDVAKFAGPVGRKDTICQTCYESLIGRKVNA